MGPPCKKIKKKLSCPGGLLGQGKCGRCTSLKRMMSKLYNRSVHKWSGFQMIDHLKTRWLKCPVFKCFWYLNVRFSDPHCICIVMFFQLMKYNLEGCRQMDGILNSEFKLKKAMVLVNENLVILIFGLFPSHTALDIRRFKHRAETNAFRFLMVHRCSVKF